jgi:hypothetical protein
MCPVYERSRSLPPGRGGPVTERSYKGKRPRNRPPKGCDRQPGSARLPGRRAQERQWRSRLSTSGSTVRSRPRVCVEDEDPRRQGRACRLADLGLRRVEHEPGAGQGVRLRAPSRRVYPDPLRGEPNVLVMSEVLLPNMTPHPDQHAGRAPTRRREVRSSRAVVRYRAGVHVLQRAVARTDFPKRVPRAAGLLLLRRRRRRGVRP